MKRLGSAFLAVAALAACADSPEPAPRADPALVERLAVANSAEPESPRLEKADRLVAAAARTEPDRLAGAAETLLER